MCAPILLRLVRSCSQKCVEKCYR
ncbi:glycine cleavage system T protein, partial [Vibrio parahaemolyticus V-223/04]